MSARRGRDGPSDRTIVRVLLFVAIVAVPGTGVFGGDALHESAAAIRTGTTPYAPLIAGGVVVVGAVLAVRAGWSLRGGANGVETGIPDEGVTCRVCGRELGRRRNRCPHCETREPINER
ncbi:hypothetical protein [Halorussus amylolyticus]|uniref:hypothetical protein n=1 Tax=Halorussus amylolyticus TaxID=1126242 RepID=UPI00104C670D|nr:hypothetical protein [Halorussus amylolyticus]